MAKEPEKIKDEFREGITTVIDNQERKEDKPGKRRNGETAEK